MRLNSFIYAFDKSALAVFALAGLMNAAPAVAQCLEVRVLDPTSAQLPTAVVSVGTQEVPAGDNGVASLCDLGPGPLSLVVIAPGFEPQEIVVRESSGEITVILQIETVAQELVVIGTRAEARTVTESAGAGRCDRRRTNSCSRAALTCFRSCAMSCLRST